MAIAILQKMDIIPRDEDTAAVITSPDGRRQRNESSAFKDLQVIYICPDRDGTKDTKEVLTHSPFYLFCARFIFYAVTALMIRRS